MGKLTAVVFSIGLLTTACTAATVPGNDAQPVTNPGGVTSAGIVQLQPQAPADQPEISDLGQHPFQNRSLHSATTARPVLPSIQLPPPSNLAGQGRDRCSTLLAPGKPRPMCEPA